MLRGPPEANYSSLSLCFSEHERQKCAQGSNRPKNTSQIILSPDFSLNESSLKSLDLETQRAKTMGL